MYWLCKPLDDDDDDGDDNDDDLVDGVRLRLWTAATNGPDAHPPGDIWARRTMVEWRGNLLIRPPELSGNPTSSHVVASRRNGRREVYKYINKRHRQYARYSNQKRICSTSWDWKTLHSVEWLLYHAVGLSHET
jgi:hypothetical protein